MKQRRTIVILHGWQSRLSRWQPLVEILQKKFKVFLPSLPGFEKKLTKAWKLKDYADWLEDYLAKKKIDNPVLVGHSFGGQLAVKFLSRGNRARKLILIASSGIDPKNNFKKAIFLLLAKTGKVFFLLPPFSFFRRFAVWFLYKLAREQDYFRADEFLKLTMRNVLRERLEPLLKKIQVSTLILWGKKDKITPVADAYIFAGEIKDSRLKVFKDGDHGLPFKLVEKVAREIISFC